MSIDEAITHCEEVADGQTEQGKCPECAMEHRQLAEWLTELKHYRERVSCDDEGIAPKSLAIAFQFGMAFGFAKRYDEMDKVMEELKKAITPKQQPSDICTDLCKSCDTKGCIFQSGIKREKCDFYTCESQIESEVK